MKNCNLTKVCSIAVSLVFIAALIACYAILSGEGIIIYADFTLPTSLERFFNMHYPLWNQYGSTSTFGFISRLSFRAIPIGLASLFEISADSLYKMVLFFTFFLSGLAMYFSLFSLKFSNNNKIACIGALSASFIYMFNFKAIHTVIWPTLHFAYAIAPITLFSFIRLVSAPRLKYAVAVAFLMTIMAASPHYLVFMTMLLFSWLLYYTGIKKLKNINLKFIKLLSFSLLLFLFINSYWLLPYIGATAFSPTPSSPTLYILTLESIDMLSRSSSIINTVRLTDIWWQHSSLMPQNVLLQGFWIFSSFFLPLLAFSSLIVSNKKYKEYTIFFCLVSAFIIIMSTGTNTVFSHIYSWLTLEAPLGWLWRAPNKLTMILVMTYSYSCGIALISFLNTNRIRGIIITTLSLALFIVSISPMATGYLYGVFTPVKIPGEYYETNNFIYGDSEYKVLWLPLAYSGSVSWAQQKIIGLIDVRSSSMPTIATFEPRTKSYLVFIDEVLVKNKSENIDKLLAPLNIKYVIFHNDTNAYKSTNLTELLDGQNNIALVSEYNFISIFENSNFADQLSVAANSIFAVSGLDDILSLTSMEFFFNPSTSSLFFLDQISLNELYSSLLSGEVQILGEHPANLLLLFYDEEYLIAPYDATNHHAPSNYWSIAKTSDPLHGPWHYYLEQRKIENWDFDYGVGLVFSWATTKLKETPTPTNNDLINQWTFDSISDLNQWKNHTRETQFGALRPLTLDNGALKAELWNSTWGWKTITSPLITAEYGNWYRWELQIKGENAHSVHIKIVEYNQEQKIVNARQVKSVGSGNFDWNSITIDYTPEKPETRYIQLQIWHGHETTQPLPNNIWIDHFKVYDLKRFVEPVTLDIPYNLPQTDQYILLARVFQNQQGGKILVQNDQENHVVNTRDQLNKFTWIQLDNTTLQKGQHKLTLTNLEGFNAVNLFALVPTQKYREVQTQLMENLQDKRIIHILEAESDMYRENTATTNKYGGEASNGETLEIAPDSKIWREIETVKPGNYTIAVRGRGTLNVKIDEQEYQTYTDHLDWTYIGPIHLEKGTPRIEITSPPTYLAQWNFEKDEPLEWKGTISNVQTLSQSQRPYEGATSLEAELNVSTWGWKTITSPLITVTPNTKYKWSFQVSGENVHKAHVKMVEYNQDKKPLTGQQMKGIGDGNFTWTPINFDYTPTQNATYIVLQIWHGHETTQPLPNRIWLDDVQVTGYQPSDLDVVWLYSNDKENETLEDIFKADETPAKLLEYTKIDPTKYIAKVNATKPFMLSFAESYDPLWVARTNGQKTSSIPLYSVINGFWIEETGIIDITIEYEPQRWFYMGSTISFTTLIACAIYLTHDWTKNKAILKRVKKWLRSNSS